MEGNGPITGTPVDLGVVVVADDPVAADVVGAQLMGVDPARLPYLAEAGRFLGQSDLDRIVERAEDPSRFAVALDPAPGSEGILAG
jgi:uncharacterized protein (DUF362 family)